MKKFSLLVLCLAAASAGASAQQLIVTQKDGTVTRIPTDYIHEITIEQAQELGVELTTFAAQPFGRGNVVLTFATDDGETSFALDTYGPTDASYLREGEYTIDSSMDEFTIDPGTYTVVNVNGESRTIESGKMTVTRDELIYTCTLDFTFTDGSTFYGTYTGEATGYSPDIHYVADEAKYTTVNDQAAGEFYIKMNDAYWSYELALDIFADASATELPAGTYTYSDEPTAGNFGSRSYIDIYSPYESLRFTDGTIDVTRDGENYTIVLNGNLSNGRPITVTYTGTIDGTPRDLGVEFNVFAVNPYSKGNVSLTFTTDDGAYLFELDTYGPVDATYLYEGEYTIDSSTGPFTIDPGTYTFVAVNGENRTIESGKLTVTRNEKIYTFTLDFTFTDGTTFYGTYIGEVPGYSPYVEYVANAASYASVNDQVDGEFYIKMNDANWSYELALDIFTDASATELPTGTYTFSDEPAAGNFGPRSYIDIYSPYASLRFTDGTIDVKRDGENYNITLNANLSNGIILTVTYTGTIE